MAFRISHSECRIPNIEYRIPNAEFRISYSEYRIPNIAFRILSSEYRTSNTEYCYADYPVFSTALPDTDDASEEIVTNPHHVNLNR